MKVTKKTKTTSKFILELNDWEANDLETILARINHKDSIRKSEFSMREKSTGRRLLNQLRFIDMLPPPKSKP